MKLSGKFLQPAFTMPRDRSEQFSRRLNSFPSRTSFRLPPRATEVAFSGGSPNNELMLGLGTKREMRNWKTVNGRAQSEV
jgi:hypothetical protein